MNQLIREDDVDNNYTYCYTYDLSGNILKKYKFNRSLYPASVLLTTKLDTSDSTWGDLLTNYNGTNITYDEIGNPLNWRNTVNMSWSVRQLVSHDNLDNSIKTTYTYNSEGIRTKKSIRDLNTGAIITTSYTLDGTKILSQNYRNTKTLEDSYLYFIYDETGSVSGFNDGTNTYFYQKNIQGDIIRILDVNGNIVVEYTYDAWGKVLSVTGTLADTIGQKNPFRYRGYYYDSETGWYYLNSRYYDPEVCRFISEDGIIGANGGIVGFNLFAYCNNNPVKGYDPSGKRNEEFRPAPTCPEQVLEQTGESNRYYSGTFIEDGYTVYEFSHLTYSKSKRYLIFGEETWGCEGQVRYYYFQTTDYKSMYLKYMNKYNVVTSISQLMNVSDGADYFNNYTIVLFTPIGIITLPVATGLTIVGYAQYFAVDPYAEHLYEMAMYYYNKPDEFKLKYTKIEYRLGEHIWRTRYIYNE